MTLEEQIKHYRKQAGLSQEKMAEKIGVSRKSEIEIDSNLEIVEAEV